MDFVKMHACSNDYVYCDFDKVSQYDFSRLSIAVSKRRYSVGSDGLIVVKKLSPSSVQMIMYNADGSRGATCGNGVRCSALFAQKYLGIKSDVVYVVTDANTTEVRLFKENNKVYAKADMGLIKIVNSAKSIAEKLQKVGLYVDYRQIYQVDVGNSHLVFLFAKHSLQTLAKAVKKSGAFKDGINIEAVKHVNLVGSTPRLFTEVYERGSGKTLSCGTGACAVFTAFNHFNKKAYPAYEIMTEGGILTVEKDKENTFLSSEITQVFSGTLNPSMLLGAKNEI